jgi:type I restriction enzyme, S subunit
MDRPWISTGVRVAEITANDVPSLLLQRVGRLRSRRGLDQSYLRLLLMSRQFQAYFEPILTGISVPHISPQQVLAFQAPIPPLEQQQAIVQQYRAMSETLDTSVRRVEAEISLVREYRTRLIADVVTGKVDMRHLAPADVQPPVGNLEETEGVLDDELTSDDDGEPDEGVDDADE